ncbi:carboxymuconolactone decarboxylase family protein [Actinomadura rubrisoli]|uniref:Carboxymuconolactone decarboxylase family protein n=1 Tax=Actinomadura rubrisoli TaxID=2530368 RepID=A0A4R5A4K4_9ACTN|nr:peroxidase-related enzyme [Actinomadura rubrisoli]TDD65604.1 carboxymuconolactone decarboxylase family protein [Actinomadura rubrisoli]
MPHIDLENDAPGIFSLFAYRPETAGPMTELAETLLRGPSTLSRGERELIATYVSDLNGCEFCASSHAAFAAAQLPEGGRLAAQFRADPDAAAVSGKLKALLRVAEAVQRGGPQVRPDDIQAARDAGATDLELHDTVLIAAAFCMYNRYVDGLGTTVPDDPAAYEAAAELIVNHGYTAVTRASG